MRWNVHAIHAHGLPRSGAAPLYHPPPRTPQGGARPGDPTATLRAAQVPELPRPLPSRLDTCKHSGDSTFLTGWRGASQGHEDTAQGSSGR